MNIDNCLRLPNLTFYNLRRLDPLVLAQILGIVR